MIDDIRADSHNSVYAFDLQLFD